MTMGLEFRDLLADVVVGERLTGDQALGCQQRAEPFLLSAGHADDDLIPAGKIPMYRPKAVGEPPEIAFV